jgi:hypothetical protein
VVECDPEKGIEDREKGREREGERERERERKTYQATST